MGCGASKGVSSPTRVNAGASNRRPSGGEFQEVAVADDPVAKPSVEDYFELGDKIGKGTFGYCYYAVTRTTGVPVAVKSLLRKNKRFNTDNVTQELQMLRRVNHPSCISIIAHFEDEEAVHIVTTLAPGGDLLDRLLAHGTMNDANTATVVRQLMDALAYLHANDFVHRDVKPENILMMSKDPKSPHFNRILLSDFGMAQQRPNIHTNVLKTLIGTPEFSAPEVLAIARHGCTPGVPNSTQYSCAIDLWAAGCVTYTMLSSTTPFTSHKGANVPGMIDRIMHGRYSFAAAAWSNVSAQAIDIIRRLLTVAPAKRLTAPQALYHPFLYTPGQQDEEPLHVLGEELPPLATRRSGSMDRTGLSAKQSVLQSRIAAMGGSSFATFANMATISGGMGQDDSFTMRQSPFQATTPLAGGRTPSLRGSVSPSVASGTPTQHHASPSHRIPGSPQQSHLPPPSPGSHTSSSPPVHRVTSFGAPYPHGHNHPPSPGNPGAASPSHHAHDLGVKRDSVLQYREITTSGDMGDTSDRSVDSRAITSQHSSRGQGSFDKNTNPVEQARHRGSMNSTPVVLTPTGMDKTTFAKELSGVSAGSPAPISGGGVGTPPVPSGGKPPRSGSSRKMRVEMSPTASPVRLADPVG